MGLLTPGEKNKGSEKPALSLNLPHKEALVPRLSWSSPSRVEGSGTFPASGLEDNIV